MLTSQTTALGLQVQDWQQAVREAGKLLVRVGAVEPRYVDAMIQMVQEIGPYIVIAPGVALPHARPEDGAKGTGMSLVTLNPPVNFGNKHNDPVELVIAFAAADDKAHIEALAELARLLEDPNILGKIKQASSPEELLSLIERKGHSKHGV
jgi:mannitol/fructose-specific phosphotransferase system IIA component (Ntr-type)